MGDDPLKSAYELAMERLRAKDGEAAELASLTDDQKRRIQEIRAEFKAKRAELELGYKEQIAKARQLQDMGRVEQLEQEFREEKERLEAREEEQVKQVREGG